MLTEDETGENRFQSALSDGDHPFLQVCRKVRTARVCRPASTSWMHKAQLSAEAEQTTSLRCAPRVFSLTCATGIS